MMLLLLLNLCFYQDEPPTEPWEYGEWLISKGRFDDAARHFQTKTDEMSPGRRLYGLAWVRFHQGAFDKAESHLKFAIKEFDDLRYKAPFHELLGRVYLFQNKSKLGIEQADLALKYFQALEEPQVEGEFMALLLKARSYLNLMELDKAEDALLEVRMLMDNLPNHQYFYLSVYANVKMLNGDFQRAHELITEGIESLDESERQESYKIYQALYSSLAGNYKRAQEELPDTSVFTKEYDIHVAELVKAYLNRCLNGVPIEKSPFVPYFETDAKINSYYKYLKDIGCNKGK